ncbi:MAG: helix-turn-helix domain-containing protein, partial [Rhodobacter sp.]|nr:helix-turn-helix domain-containing protein [Rhodobacter sp.]
MKIFDRQAEGKKLSTIGERLREERQRLGLSQTALAATASVGKHSQINYESDRNAPDANYLTAAAKQGVDIYYVLTGRRTNLGATYDLMARIDRQHGPALEMARKAAEMEAAIEASFGPQYIPI